MKKVIIFSVITLALTAGVGLFFRARSGNEVILSVDARQLTRGEYQQYISMMGHLVKYRNPKVSDQRTQKLAQQIAKNGAKTFVRRLLLESGLAQSVTNVLPAVRARVEKQYAQSFCPKGKSFGDLVAYVDSVGCRAIFDRCLTGDAIFFTALETVYSNRYYATEAQYRKAKDDVRDYNADAAATNRINRALGAEIVRKARAGADFTQLVKQYSYVDDDEPGIEVECQESDFTEDKHLWPLITLLRDGQVTDLQDTSTGFAIIKVLRHVKPEDSNSGEPAVVISRINLRKAYEFPEKTESEFREQVAQEIREKCVQDMIVDFRKKAKIAFPLGREVFANPDGKAQPKKAGPAPKKRPVRPTAGQAKKSGKSALNSVSDQTTRTEEKTK